MVLFIVINFQRGKDVALRAQAVATPVLGLRPDFFSKGVRDHGYSARGARRPRWTASRIA